MATFTQQVAATGDDGGWSIGPTSPYFSTSAAIIRIGDGSSTDYDRSAWFRFPGVTIPKGAKVTAATLTFTSGGFTTGPPPMVVKAEAADNAATVTSRTDVTGRARAATVQAWTPASWPASGSTITTVDFAPVVQQITDRAGWVSGNALQLFLEDTSVGWVSAQQVSIQAQEGTTPGQGAVLNVTYTVGAVPTASATVPGSVASGATYTVTDTSTATGGTITSRVWRVVSGGGSLSSTTVAAPTVTAPTTTTGTTQVLGLIVTDSNGNTSTERTYSVTVTAAPVANAGPDLGPVASLATVQLSSAASTGSPNAYAWAVVSGGGALSSTTAANPTLKAPATTAGVTVVVQLQVGTGAATSAADTVQVTVRPHQLWGVSGGTLRPLTLNTNR